MGRGGSARDRCFAAGGRRRTAVQLVDCRRALAGSIGQCPGRGRRRLGQQRIACPGRGRRRRLGQQRIASFLVGGAGVVLQRGAAQRGPSGLAVVVERQSLCLDVFPAACLARRRPLGVDHVLEVRRVVRAAVVDPLIFFLFSEIGHFCELGGSRELRRPFRRKAGAKRFACRPGGLREPRGRPDFKNDRLLNFLACDKMVAEAALATK